MQRDEDSVWWRHASLIGWKAIMPDPSARPSRFSLKKLWVILMLAVSAAIPATGFGQTAEPLDVTEKLEYHVKNACGPMSIVGDAAYAAILQADDAPLEWKQGGAAFGKRVASMVAWSGIRNALAFGLDSPLHEDPRYFRSSGTGFWRRSGHALRGTLLTRTDSGGETLSIWRVGSAYGSAVLSNLWYPDRLNTARLGFIQGSATLGLDLLGNIGREFWPDVKKKVLHRKRRLNLKFVSPRPPSACWFCSRVPTPIRTRY